MAQIKLLGKTNIQGKTIFDTGVFAPSDSDAISYITAVEAADGQDLESPVKQAIENFIVGCKSDGIWTDLKSSCILAGARTLNGALVPLVGTAPTNFNFVSSDYNRKTGLVGNGTTKYLNSNRSAYSDPQNDVHMSVYVSTASASGRYYLGHQGNVGYVNYRYSWITTNVGFMVNNDINLANNVGVGATGLIAASRASSTQATYHINGNSTTVNNASKIVNDLKYFVYARNVNGSLGTNLANGRLSFYSIGEAINLALLDTRVSALMTALNTAI